MKFSYEIKNRTKEEENIINSIIKYISENYSEKINIDKLKEIEIVDKLDNDSSGRSIRNKIILPRKYGLEGIQYKGDISKDTVFDTKLKMLISTIYHELWHISTREKYETMYGYVLRKENVDMYTLYAYMYWIEYIAHVETVFMEVPDIMKTFCENFVRKKWHKIEYGYSYFIKALPYYLVRSQYLGIYDELTEKIECDELRNATIEFDMTSKRLLQNVSIEDIEKAKAIRKIIENLFN